MIYLKNAPLVFCYVLLFDDSYPFVPLEKILKGAVHSNAELALIGAEQWEKQVNEIVSKKLIYYNWESCELLKVQSIKHILGTLWSILRAPLLIGLY